MIKALKKIALNSDMMMGYVCVLLLTIKVTWVCVHMFFHYHGMLNPWKLDGYAMYTRPPLSYYATIDTLKIESEADLNRVVVSYLKLYATSGCLGGVSKRFYKKLPVFRPDLIEEGGFVRMSFFEQEDLMSRTGETNKLIGQVTIRFNAPQKMQVEEEFCGKHREFSISY